MNERDLKSYDRTTGRNRRKTRAEKRAERTPTSPGYFVRAKTLPFRYPVLIVLTLCQTEQRAAELFAKDIKHLDPFQHPADFEVFA